MSEGLFACAEVFAREMTAQVRSKVTKVRDGKGAVLTGAGARMSVL